MIFRSRRPSGLALLLALVGASGFVAGVWADSRIFSSQRFIEFRIENASMTRSIPDGTLTGSMILAHDHFGRKGDQWQMIITQNGRRYRLIVTRESE